MSTGAVIDFIEGIFDKENISYIGNTNIFLSDIHMHDVKIVITNYDMPKKSDMDELLDKCILLNTYMSGYFSECEHISGYDIYYREDYFEEKFDLFDSQPIKEPMHSLFQDSLFINELVRFNTEAESKVENNRLSGEYTKYNYVFTKLKNNLIKEANG